MERTRTITAWAAMSCCCARPIRAPDQSPRLAIQASMAFAAVYRVDLPLVVANGDSSPEHLVVVCELERNRLRGCRPAP